MLWQQLSPLTGQLLAMPRLTHHVLVRDTVLLECSFLHFVFSKGRRAAGVLIAAGWLATATHTWHCCAWDGQVCLQPCRLQLTLGSLDMLLCTC